MNDVQKSVQSALKGRTWRLDDLITWVSEETGQSMKVVAKEIWRLVDGRVIDVTPDRKMAERIA